MSAQLVPGLALVFGLGVAAQWIAWRLRLPAILFLLATGLLAGPVFGLVDPDRLFAQNLLPLVSVCVALILFEGGLSLHWKEIREIGGALFLIVTLGALVTWLTLAGAAHWILGLEVGISLLIGATLVVTGPTVIGPLLRHIRPIGPSANLLKWEGIVIDPIGATLALLVFNALVTEHASRAAMGMAAAKGIGLTLVVGFAFGLLGAFVILQAIRRYWIPDFLQVPLILTLVVVGFAASDAIMHESGFLTVTVMGIAVGNQRKVAISHIIEFKENLRTILIASLFILLSARIDFAVFNKLGWPILGFLAVVILIARPVSVFLSTLGSNLSGRDRLFLSWMAPRGIVAAAVSSVFALELKNEGIAGADKLVAVTFSVIVATVALYGLTSGILARRLGVAGPPPQGLLLVGAHDWARALAKKLKDAGFPVVLADTNRDNVRHSKLEGLGSWWGNALNEHELEEHLDFGGIGRVIALTPNDEVNRLVAPHLTELFGRAECYRLAERRRPGDEESALTHDQGGRIAFESDMSFNYIEKRWRSGAQYRLTKISENFDFEAFIKETKASARVLFLIREGELLVNASDRPLNPKTGDTILSLADEVEDSR